MSQSRFLAACVCIGMLVSSSPAPACGDKFLLLGRSVRYEEAYAAKHPASVLVYSNPATGFSAAAGDVTAILAKAGHKPVAAEERPGLAAALKSGAFDVVFADVADVEAVDAALRAAGSKAVVLGVVYNLTGKELNAAEKKYSCILNAKGKDKHFLAVVNEVMRLRAKGQAPDCKKA
ncbi:MAG: hypothetical protein ABI584_04910 [Acidobacteriota bacterium]